MLRRRTRWFRRLATGLAFATLAAPAAAKVDEGGSAAATPKVIPYLSHGMTTSTDANGLSHYEALTHRQLEELAASRAIGNGDALTHRQMEELAASRAIGNGDALTHRQMEELANANEFIPGVTDFPKPVAIESPTVINYVSHGKTEADYPGYANRIQSASVLGELVKSPRPVAAVRPDDQGDRFAISSVDATASSTSSDSGLTWDGAMMIGIGTLVVVLALGLGFGFVRRPRIAGL